MTARDEQGSSSWGARINTSWWGSAKDWPAWATPRQREKWREHGLILWDHEGQQVTRLSATHALQLLNHLRTTEEWRQLGLTVGEPATTLFLDEPDREPEPAFIDSMNLSPDQLHELLELLERRESDLQELSESEAEDRRRRLSKVYGILIDLANHQEQEKASDAADGSE